MHLSSANDKTKTLRPFAVCLVSHAGKIWQSGDQNPFLDGSSPFYLSQLSLGL